MEADQVLLSERQKREQEFYEEYYQRGAENQLAPVNFDPVLGREERPWNSYWALYKEVRDQFNGKGKTLLDFGSGSGHNAICFAHVGYRVFGFDISEYGVGVANQLAKKYSFEKSVQVVVGAAEKLKYPNETFDVVAGVDILHHVDIPKAILETKRVLKRGGVAVFREPIEAPVFEWFRTSWLVTRFFPKSKSLDRHVTEDEKKLAPQDLNIIRAAFPNCEITRFLVFSRLDRFIKDRRKNGPSKLEQLDHLLLKIFPFLGSLGGAVLIKLTKE